jgi:FkbM family methyltransferase
MTRSMLREAVRRVTPKSLRVRARSLLAWPDTLRLVSDVESFRRFRALERSTARWAPGESTVAVRLRALGGAALHLRPGSADPWVVRDTFLDGSHRPPDGLVGADARLIWDLGAHMGSTMADLAVRHPGARVVGVELDPENARLCRTNLAPWADRTELVEAAVWTHDGRAAIEMGADDVAHRVSSSGADGESAGGVPAISLDTLLERCGGGPGARVDWVKMDIEGAERSVLREATGWASAVRAMQLEVHPPYTVDECLADLRALGFRAWLASPAEGAGMPGVVAVRDSA